MRGRPPRIFRPKLPEKPYVDPNRPGSPDYAQRHQEVRSEIMPGMLRIDIGCPSAPPIRREAEARPEPANKPTPTAPDGAPAERDWRDDYGLAKRP